jgi:uncharacterized protein (TIGR02246 family)
VPAPLSKEVVVTLRPFASSFLVVGFVAAAVSVASAQSAAVRSAIEAGNKKFGAGVAKGDAAGVAGLYTEDAQALPPGGDAVKGRAAILKMWQGVFDAGIAGAVLTTLEVDVMGDTAAEVGTFLLTTKDGRTADRGKYIVLWKKVNGQWYLHRDIWNSSQPPAPAK